MNVFGMFMSAVDADGPLVKPTIDVDTIIDIDTQQRPGSSHERNSYARTKSDRLMVRILKSHQYTI